MRSCCYFVLLAVALAAAGITPSPSPPRRPATAHPQLRPADPRPTSTAHRHQERRQRLPRSRRPLRHALLEPQVPRRRPPPDGRAGGYQYDATRIRGFSGQSHVPAWAARAARRHPLFRTPARVTSSSPATPGTWCTRPLLGAHRGDRRAWPRQGRPCLRRHRRPHRTPRAPALLLHLPRRQTRLAPGPHCELRGRAPPIDPLDSATPHRSPGSVTSGNFCGYLDPEGQRADDTLHFTARFDRDFQSDRHLAGRQAEPGVHGGERRHRRLRPAAVPSWVGRWR